MPRSLTAAALGLLVIGGGVSVLARQVPPSQSPTRDGRPTPATAAAISGAVVSADAGRPVRNARVTVFGGDQRLNRSVSTDDQGRFALSGLAQGDYIISVSKTGYLDAQYGQREPGSSRPGTTIHLNAAQKIENLSVRLPRGGAIMGRIVDDAGEPVFDAPVTAYRFAMQSGERTLIEVGEARSDDRGVYRIPVLVQGDYIVKVAAKSEDESILRNVLAAAEGRLMEARQRGAQDWDQLAREYAEASERYQLVLTQGNAPVYYPGSTRVANATTVSVGLSEERSGIDIPVQMVPAARITGSVLSPIPAQIQLIDPDAPAGLGVTVVRTNETGVFTFNNVAPGQYQLLARTVTAARFTEAVPTSAPRIATETPAMLWGIADITANASDRLNVTISMQPGMTVSGRIEFEGAPAPNLQNSPMTVRAIPISASIADRMTTPVAVAADGTFTITGVLPGIYKIDSMAGVPSPFAIKSSMFNGRDSLDVPLQVKPGESVAGGVLTFSNKTTTLGGQLQDGAGQPATAYTLIVFPGDRTLWTPGSRRIRGTRPASDGSYSFRLPPGDYRIAAVTDVEPGQWFDPAYLTQLFAAASPVTLVEGQNATQSFRVK